MPIFIVLILVNEDGVTVFLFGRVGPSVRNGVAIVIISGFTPIRECTIGFVPAGGELVSLAVILVFRPGVKFFISVIVLKQYFIPILVVLSLAMPSSASFSS